MFRFLALLALVPAILAGRVTFEACRDGGHLPNWIEITGCSLDSCPISRTGYLSVRGEVTTLTSSEQLAVSMSTFILGLEVHLDLPANIADGCQVTACPLSAGNTVLIEATTQIPIEEYAVGMTLPVEMAVVNENANRVFCVRTSVTITP